MTTITITAWGTSTEVYPEFGRYANGRLAIRFFCEDGPFATLTTNIEHEPLAADEHWIKDWSENEPLVDALIDSGWIEYTNREAQAGFAIAKAVHLTGPLLDAYSRFMG